MKVAPNQRRNARIAVGLFVVALAAAAPGLLRVQVERDATIAFIPKTGAVGETYARYLDLFPGDLGTVVVATGELCTPEKWQALVDLSEDLEGLSVVDKVTGLTTVDYIVGKADVVEVKDFISLRPQKDENLCHLARAYRPYKSLLLSEDLRAMALYVRGVKDLDEVTINAQIAPVVERHRQRFLDGDDGDLFQAGSTYQNAEINRLTARSSLLVGVAAIIMLLTSWYMTKLLRAGILSIVCGLVGILWTLALMGYAGVKVDPMNSLVIQVLVPLGAAFTIHAWGYAGASGSWRWGLIPEAAIWPFAFAVVTTMVGFGATAVSTVPTVRYFGLLGMFGIGVCAVTTAACTFPLLLGRHAELSRADPRSLPLLLEYPLRTSRRKTLLLVGVLLLLIAGGLLRVRVDYGPLDYLPGDNQVRIDMDRGGKLFNRITAQMMISGDQPNAVLDPHLWKEVRTFTQDMERKYPGLRTSWIYDQVSELSRAFTADQIEPVALPGSKNLIIQYLLLLDPQEVEPYLDWDRRTMNVVFRVPWQTSTGFRPFKQDVLEFSQRTGVSLSVTGKVAAFWEIIERMSVENVQSLAIGLALVFLLLCVLTRTSRIAAIAALVNAVPVLGSLAFLGFMQINLDLGSSVVSTIALGIVVDDTGHLVVRYLQHRRAGATAEAAARLMLFDLWKPVLTTSVVIVIGFSVMNLAELAPFHTFSRTLSMAVICALFADLALLPALLIHFDRHQAGNTAPSRAIV